MLSKANIISAARECIGVPFHHQGFTLAGMDCAGPIYYVLDRCDHKVPDEIAWHDYDKAPDGSSLVEAMDWLFGMHEIEHDQRGPGDVLIFWMSRRLKRPQHCSIMTTLDRFVHVYNGGPRRCVESPMNGKWVRHLNNLFRFNERID